jgi:hypothetical protein
LGPPPPPPSQELNLRSFLVDLIIFKGAIVRK